MLTIRQFSHVRRANAVSTVPRDLPDLKARSDLMAMMAHPDRRVFKENAAQSDHSDVMVDKVFRVNVVNLDLLAHPAHLV